MQLLHSCHEAHRFDFINSGTPLQKKSGSRFSLHLWPQGSWVLSHAVSTQSSLRWNSIIILHSWSHHSQLAPRICHWSQLLVIHNQFLHTIDICITRQDLTARSFLISSLPHRWKEIDCRSILFNSVISGPLILRLQKPALGFGNCELPLIYSKPRYRLAHWSDQIGILPSPLWYSEEVPGNLGDFAKTLKFIWLLLQRMVPFKVASAPGHQQVSIKGTANFPYRPFVSASSFSKYKLPFSWGSSGENQNANQREMFFDS